MADLTITAGNVAAGSGTTVELVTAGDTITAGMALYLDTADSKYKKARANASGTSACGAIALASAANGQPLPVVKPERGGNINLGATLTVGATYVVSAAVAGAIAPIGDLASTNHPVIIGVASSASNMIMTLIDPNTAKA